MCVKPKPGEKVVPIRCQPVSYPCPTCGQRGHRNRRLDRFVRSLAYGQVLWLHVFYAEYTARCDCRKYFRSWVPNSCPKAEYDNLVRAAVLNRILDDGLNVERTRACMKRDFLLELSDPIFSEQKPVFRSSTIACTRSISFSICLIRRSRNNSQPSLSARAC